MWTTSRSRSTLPVPAARWGTRLDGKSALSPLTSAGSELAGAGKLVRWAPSVYPTTTTERAAHSPSTALDRFPCTPRTITFLSPIGPCGPCLEQAGDEAPPRSSGSPRDGPAGAPGGNPGDGDHRLLLRRLRQAPRSPLSPDPRTVYVGIADAAGGMVSFIRPASTHMMTTSQIAL